MTKLERQFAVWRKLAGLPEGATVRDLAQDLSISKNTIQRDLDELTLGGVQIRVREAGQTKRYTVDQGPFGGKALTSLEQDALDAATVAMQGLAPTPLAPALAAARQKLVPGGRKSAFAPTRGAGPPVGPAVFEPLLRAIMDDRACTLVYTARQRTQAKTYDVEPYHFFTSEGVLYMRARVPPHPGLRTFLAHKIAKVTLGRARFERQPWEPTGFGVYEEKAERVEVRFAPEVAEIISEHSWHRTQELTWQRDGSLLFRAKLSGKHEFVAWVMRWAPWAELVQPTAWRTEVLTRSQALAQLHKVDRDPAG